MRILVIQPELDDPPHLFGDWLSEAGATLEVQHPYAGDAVPTLDGEQVTLKIPEGTPSGKVFRVKGRGVKVKKGTGDLLVTVQITVPRKLSKQQREAIEAFAEATTESPREHLEV